MKTPPGEAGHRRPSAQGSSGMLDEAFSLDCLNDAVDPANSRFANDQPLSLYLWTKPTSEAFSGSNIDTILGSTSGSTMVGESHGE